MKRIAVVISLCVLTNLSLAQVVKPRLLEPNDPVATPLKDDANGVLTETVSREHALAAKSFRLSAAGVMQLPDAKAPGGRAAMLAMASEELDPTNIEVHRMLADFMEIAGFREKAAYQAMLCLRADPNNHSAGLRWLDRSLVLMQGAQARNDFLEDVAQRGDLPKPLRAEAYARQGALLARQGLQRAAVAAFNSALELDGLNPLALTEQARLGGQIEPTNLVPLNVKMLRGNPMSAQAAWSLGSTLGREGVYAEAMRFFDYAWLVSRRKTAGGNVPTEYTLTYAGSMLDANAPQKVIETFGDQLQEHQPVFMVKDLHEPWDLRVQAIEAYRMAGMDANATALQKTVAQDYETRAEKAESSIQLARQLAMFYAITADDWSTASRYIKISERINADSADVQAFAGMMRIKNGQIPAGEKMLRESATGSVWGCAFLADHLYREAKLAEAARMVRRAADLSRRGWAFRHLKDVVARHDTTIPDNPLADQLAGEVKDLIDTWLPAWTHPEKLLTVKVRPLRKAVYPTEDIEVEITLTNTGKLAVPMGNWGLLSPAFAMRVTVPGQDPNGEVFDRLPLVVLPAPRYLQPGQSVTQRTSINVGPLRHELMSRPMDTIELTIDAILDPVVVEKDKETRLYSPLPTVPVETIQVTRRPLAELYPKAKRSTAKDSFLYLIAYVVKDMRTGSVARRMRSARLAGSLMAYAQRVDAGKARAPEGVRKAWLSGYAMSMMRELLDRRKQPSFAVRAELLAGLRYVDLNDTTKKLLRGAFDDPSPYVRLRLVELIGSDDQVSFRRNIRKFAEDDSALVQTLVAAFEEAW
jgi:tetratricopeptide (TPR) repeat protein